jgi:hypothetical protein
MLIRLINKLLQRRGWILMEREMWDECLMLSIAYQAGMQQMLGENEVAVYDRLTHTVTVATRH